MSKPDGFGKSLENPLVFAWVVVVLGAFAYSVTYGLNHWLFSQIEFNHRVNWLFIPSGVRLLLVLLLDHLGALGIILGSFIVELFFFDQSFEPADLVSPIISGAAPFLAKMSLQRWFRVGSGLEHLNAKRLAQYAVWFAFFSASLHQAWFAMQLQEAYQPQGWIPMFIGDVLGNLLVLSLLWIAVRVFRRSR